MTTLAHEKHLLVVHSIKKMFGNLYGPQLSSLEMMSNFTVEEILVLQDCVDEGGMREGLKRLEALLHDQTDIGLAAMIDSGVSVEEILAFSVEKESELSQLDPRFDSLEVPP